MTTKPSTTWVLALVGWVTQVVVLVVLTVESAHHAATLDPEREAQNASQGVFLSLFGSAVHTFLALVTGFAALLVLLVLALSARRGGSRLAGMIVGIVVEVPLVAIGVSALQDGVDAGEAVVLLGALLVLVAVVTPATWRWVRRPGRADRVPVPGVGPA